MVTEVVTEVVSEVTFKGESGTLRLLVTLGPTTLLAVVFVCDDRM